MKKTYVLFSVVLVTLALCLTGCGPGGTPTVEEATVLEVFLVEMEEIKADCRSLPSDKAEFCMEVNDARITLFQKYHDETEPKEARAKMVAISNEIQFEAKSSTKWQFSIPSVPDVVCSYHANDSVSCVETDELLAPYDSDMGQLILADIDGLYDFFDLEANADILIDCGQGLWAADSFSSYGAADKSEFLSDTFHSDSLVYPFKFNDLCYQSMLESTSDSSGSGGGLFSGLTGFDTFGNVFCGGGQPGGAGSIDAILNTFDTMMDDLAEGCEFDVQDTITEGEGSTPDPPPPPTDDEPTTPPTEPPDSDIVEETTKTTTSEDGTTTTTRTRKYANGAIVINTVTTKNGVKVSESKYIYSPGVGWIDHATFYDEAGNPIRAESQGRYEDGRSFNRVADKNEDGGWDTTMTWGNSNGGGGYQKWSTDRDGNVTWNKGKRFNPAACLFGDSCDICNAGMKVFLDALGKCSTPGGGNFGCGAYQKQWDCCSGFSGDPRIVIPNPQGDYMCSNEPVQSEEEASCELMCSLASTPDGEDCMSSCLSSADIRLWDISLMDLACIYAISDSCYQSYVAQPIGLDISTMENFFSFTIPGLIMESIIIPFEGPQ